MAAETPIGERIRAARQRRRWTQRQLAEAVGVDRKTVDNWENGRTVPRWLSPLEDALGTPLTGDVPLPDLVAAHAADERVMEIWRLERIPPDTRLAMISVMLGREATPVRRESR